MRMRKSLFIIIVLLLVGLGCGYCPPSSHAQPRQPAQVYVPVNPQVISVSGTAASSAVLKHPYFTLHTTDAIFYTTDGSVATTSGAVCHYLQANSSIDLYANRGTVVSVITADSGTGYAYITEWE